MTDTETSEGIEKLQTYTMLKQLFQSRTEIVEIIKTLIFSKDDVETTIFDGSTEKLVEVDILTKMNVLLLLSDLDISDKYISLLTSIYDFTKKEDDYKIVWIPTVEEWTLELQEKFDTLRGKMSWYTVAKTSAPIAGIKYVKEDWEFDGKPMLVVLNSQSQLQHSNALCMDSKWKEEALPFTQKKEEKNLPSLGDTWFASIVSDIHPSVSKWIKEEKYIFFYGGDLIWANHFKKKATDMVKIAQSSIELYHVKQNASDDAEDDSFSSFWSAIETMSHIKVISKQIGHDEHVVKQVKKLLSYKNSKIGWTVLIQGRRVIIIADGWTMNRVLGRQDWSDKDFDDDLVDLMRAVLRPRRVKRSVLVTKSESSTVLKHLIFESFNVPSTSIIDAYTPSPKYLKNFDTLRGSKLFLFLSGLDISEAHIKLIKHVNERIEKEKMDVYKTVWIPIAGENKWKAHEEEDKYLLHIAERLSCYAARPHPECIRNIEDMFELHKKKKKNYLVLLLMDQRGHVEEYNPAKTIEKERMARFGFKH